MAYAIWSAATHFTISGDNDEIATKTANSWRSVRADIGKSTGQHYFEIYATNISESSCYIGLASGDFSLGGAIGYTNDSWGYIGTGNKVHDSSSVSYGDAYATDATIGVAADYDNNNLYFSVDGSWQDGDGSFDDATPAYTNLSGTLYPTASLYNSGLVLTLVSNPSDYAYSAPSGYLPYSEVTITTVDVSGSPFTLTSSGDATTKSKINVNPFILASSLNMSDDPFIGIKITVDDYPFEIASTALIDKMISKVFPPAFELVSNFSATSITIVVPPVVDVNFAQILKDGLELAFGQILKHSINVIVLKEQNLIDNITQQMLIKQELKDNIRGVADISISQKLIDRITDNFTGVTYGGFSFNKRHGL